MSKVGILYDNISGNTGDAAVGLSVKKILRDIGVEFDELVPGDFNPNDYDTIIIGGGYLIRPSPDLFYDKFKVPGKHILNAVGILDSPDDLQYLDDYKCVTVSSSRDKEKLSYLKTEVHVVPCTTMLLEDLNDFSLAQKKPGLGIHLLPNMFNENEEKQFVDWISSLPFTIYFIPITHYDRDHIYLEHLSSKIQNSVLLPSMKPLEIFTFIGKLDCFIGCSLHGGIFSYIHNVPFILFNYDEKMFFFMKDRELQQYTFANYQGMRETFDNLLRASPDYIAKISRDLDVLHDYVQYLRQILPSGGSNQEDWIRSYNPGKSPDSSFGVPNNNSRSKLKLYEANTFMLIAQLQEASSLSRALERAVAKRDSQITALTSQITALTSQITALTSQITALSSQLQQALSRSQSMEQAVAERDSQIASISFQLHEANQYAHALGDYITEMQRSIVWQMTMRFHNGFVMRALPHGTRRRRWYDLGMKGGRIIVNEGHGRFLGAFKNYLLGAKLKNQAEITDLTNK